MAKSYIKKEIAEIIGYKPSLVKYYTEQGFITPEIEESHGKGTRRRYSKRNILEILIYKRLADKGIPLFETKLMIEHSLKKYAPDFYHKLKNNGVPTKEIKKLKELARLQEAFWGVDSWPSSRNAFFTIQEWDEGKAIRSDLFFPKKGEGLKFEEKIFESIQIFMVINLTDLVEKVKQA